MQIAEPGQSEARRACATTRAVGIDLGTTNSLVAVVEDGAPRVLFGEGELALLPSVVAYGPDGEVAVGESAGRVGVERPGDAIASVKRFMGRAPADLTHLRDLVPYELVGDEASARSRSG